MLANIEITLAELRKLRDAKLAYRADPSSDNWFRLVMALHEWEGRKVVIR